MKKRMFVILVVLGLLVLAALGAIFGPGRD